MADHIASIRERMDRYRRLSKSLWDRETAATMTSLADELEAQIKQLEAQRQAQN